MKNADLLLIEPKKDDFSNLIANTTSTTHNYSHVAMVYKSNDETFVIHAIPNRGVIKQRFTNFLADHKNTRIYLYRVTKDIDRGNVIKRAKDMIGKPYNNLFLNHRESFYCSQLVTYAYELEGIFKLSPLRFGQNDEIDEKWTEYYREYEMNVPIDELGSSPNLLVENVWMRLIKCVK